jgi:hypothetical protein
MRAGMNFSTNALTAVSAVCDTPVLHADKSHSGKMETGGQTDIPALNHDVAALNQLVVAVLDNADEYRRAIFAIEQLLDSLQHGLYNRAQAAEQIQCQVRALGALPATTPSSLAAAFAARLTMRLPFAKDRHEDLLHDMTRGEATLRTQFEYHLAGARLSGSSRECVMAAFDKLTTARSTPSENRTTDVTPRGLPSPIVALRAYSIAHGEESSVPNAIESTTPMHA